MDPRKKTAYFRSQDWPEEWISEAVELVRTEWRNHYKPVPASIVSTSEAAPSAAKPGRRSANAAVSAFYCVRVSAPADSASMQATRALFASLTPGQGSTPKDALEAYLESPPLTTVEDPLAYWNLIAQTDADPSLARMALDFLSVPGECLYSEISSLEQLLTSTLSSYFDRC